LGYSKEQLQVFKDCYLINHMKQTSKTKHKQVNKRVIVYSLIAFGFLALTFFVDWLFIIGAVVLMYLNQKELMKPRH
jgi:hypothetical protein